jgi:thiosulfate/3-mercaptopyruvate sulfurtransferase
MNRNDALITADELLRKLGQDNLRIFDATINFFNRGKGPTAREQYVQGHIPGAAFFDHALVSDPLADYDYTIPPEAELAAQIGKLGISAASEVVIYAIGILPAATRAWWILRYAGHNNVRVLNGGLAAWQAAGGPIEQGERRYPPATFTGQLRPEMLATKEEVLAAIGSSTVRIINTLPEASHEEAHITGSVCVAGWDLMEAMEAFSPDEVMARRLQDEARYPRIITYCGGGILATMNAMAHLMLGHENVAVYDGSMSEWVGEGLPVEGTGEGKWVMWMPKRSATPPAGG